MDLYKRIILKSLQRNNHRLSLQKCYYSKESQIELNPVPSGQSETFETYPYTSRLFHKNYIRYKQQSMAVVTHDYVFTGSERLPTLEERLKEYEDPLDTRSTVNIGLNLKTQNTDQMNKLKQKADEQLALNKSNNELLRLARNLKLYVPVDEVNKEWKQYGSFEDTKNFIEHFNIFKDLFDSGYFYSYLNFDITYENKNEVNCGNRIEAKNTSERPKLKLDNLDPSKYYTLAFMNLDGNLKDNNQEVLLWFLSNINKESNENGDELVNYIQPFPMRNTGLHRCVFVLYQHDEKIDFNEFVNLNKNSKFEVDRRSFKNLDFYLKYQERITPVSLSFFQTEWDLSVRNVFHNILNMKEPVYEYDFGKRFLPAQEKYPKNQVFNWYLEDYQDKKDINEYVMKKYMKDISPFEDYPKELEFPLIENLDTRQTPRWYKYELNDLRLRRNKWNLIPYKITANAWLDENKKRSLPYGIKMEINKEQEELLSKKQK